MAMNGNGNGTNGKHKDPVLVVIQLSGGNDFMNTVIPYTEGVYYDVRPLVGMPEDKVIPITDKLAFHPNAGCAEGSMERRQSRDRSRHWLRKFQPIALPGDGHLAHLRTGNHRDRRMAS